MSYSLSFQTRCAYESGYDKPAVRVLLSTGGQFADCLAFIDTGATVCLFQRELADNLALEVEAGQFTLLSTLTGPLPAYGHELTLQVGEITIHTIVYFAKEYGLPRNLLGKFGFLQVTRFGLVDYDEMIYLSHYDDPA